MLALIDGDVFAHRCCMSRFLTNVDGKVFQRVVLDKDSVDFTEEEDLEYFNQSWELFKKSVDEAVENCYTDKYIMAVKHSENYRSVLYPEYKMNRHKDPSKMNKFVPLIRKRAVSEGMAVEAIGREADDLLCMWAYSAMAANEPYIILSIDKDLKCIPGWHYNIKSQEKVQVSRHEADRFFYQQLLSGDPTDNIPGLPKVGPVKAAEALLNTFDEEEMQEIVVGMYMTKYPKEWYEMLLSNGKMLYLQRHEDDYFKISHWPVTQAMLEHDRLERLKEFEVIEEQRVAAVAKLSPPPVVSSEKSTSFKGVFKKPI